MLKSINRSPYLRKFCYQIILYMWQIKTLEFEYISKTIAYN